MPGLIHDLVHLEQLRPRLRGGVLGELEQGRAHRPGGDDVDVQGGQHADRHAAPGSGSCRAVSSKYSASPCGPSSRPTPDRLKPPNGARTLNRPPLIDTWPVRSRRATATEV